MGGNHTQPKFILLGITDTPWAQAPLFGLFLLIYIITLVGNVGLMVLVWVAPSLHTPMYFFLAHFSLADVCYSTIISPKMLTDLLFGNKTISWASCVTQFHLFALFATAECHLLATMAYDRHVAICHPLLYVTVVSPRACWQLVAWSYLVASLSALIYTSCTFGARAPPHRAGARAFHTCASHLVSVSVFYGALFFMYLQPASRHGSRDKVASVFYTVVSPMLNPFIYSLRNKEVKAALGKCRRRMLNHCRHQRGATHGIRESWNALGWKGH
ncbi:PREDICTED: olfactory receptor 9I1-like [Corvus brachyrhynchos]|uniref:olfactory receptor 9I1-like n=1 Tax=Corvus brachyrhynchos TaxID=85066 RepID=UPI00081633D4|nr:PREDICTED: olfactory receptor 9I1-like [Corvus brachyrhynchos]